MDYTPDYIDSLQSNQIFVFGSNTLGYHTGGASRTARKKFGAVWGQPEGLQGQSYAIPVDFGKGVRKDTEVKAAVDRFIAFAEEHPELFFLVTRVGCGIAGYHDEEMAQLFKEAKHLKNVCLPKSFIEVLNAGKVSYDLNRFLKAQGDEHGVFYEALGEIEEGKQQGNWMWFVFPQIKGLGHSYNSEFYGIANKDEAKAYLGHPILGRRLREITHTLLKCSNPSAEAILGFPNVLKLKSCMTLFDLVSPNDIYLEVLDKYFEGKRCDKTLWRIGLHDEKKKNAVCLSRLTVTKDYSIILTDYNNKVISLEPLVKAIYLLYLKHPEGIAFKNLPDYRAELTLIYTKLKPFGLNQRVTRSIDDVTNPLSNSINEKCSRIKSAFCTEVDATLVDQYVITGRSGEGKKISLPRNYVVWET